jgi:hypothetical protein
MFQGAIVVADTIKVALLNSSGVYNASHTTFAQASSNSSYELPDGIGGYAAGGASVSGGIVGTSDATASSFTLANAVVWDPASFTVANAVVYEAGTGKLLLHLAFSPSLVLTGQTFQINPPVPLAKIELPA